MQRCILLLLCILTHCHNDLHAAPKYVSCFLLFLFSSNKTPATVIHTVVKDKFSSSRNRHRNSLKGYTSNLVLHFQIFGGTISATETFLVPCMGQSPEKYWILQFPQCNSIASFIHVCLKDVSIPIRDYPADIIMTSPEKTVVKLLCTFN